jgi:hypothetical protein
VLLCIKRVNKALGNDLILNDFLKAIGSLIIVVVAALAIVY